MISASGSENTESDAYIDNKNYLNLRSHTEADATVHALQWDATTNTGHIELTSNSDNQSISSFTTGQPMLLLDVRLKMFCKQTMILLTHLRIMVGSGC